MACQSEYPDSAGSAGPEGSRQPPSEELPHTNSGHRCMFTHVESFPTGCSDICRSSDTDFVFQQARMFDVSEILHPFLESTACLACSEHLGYLF